MNIKMMCVLQVLQAIVSVFLYGYYAGMNLFEYVEESAVTSFSNCMFDFYVTLAMLAFLAVKSRILWRIRLEHDGRDPYGFFLSIKTGIMMCYALIMVPLSRVALAIPTDIACYVSGRQCSVSWHFFLADLFMAVIAFSMLLVQVYIMTKFDINASNEQVYLQRLKSATLARNSERATLLAARQKADGLSTL